MPYTYQQHVFMGSCGWPSQWWAFLHAGQQDKHKNRQTRTEVALLSEREGGGCAGAADFFAPPPIANRASSSLCSLVGPPLLIVEALFCAMAVSASCTRQRSHEYTSGGRVVGECGGGAEGTLMDDHARPVTSCCKPGVGGEMGAGGRGDLGALLGCWASRWRRRPPADRLAAGHVRQLRARAPKQPTDPRARARATKTAAAAASD